MIYNVGILGITGRMGREVLTLLDQGFLHQDVQLKLGDAVARDPKPGLKLGGVNVRTLAGYPEAKMDVWVDFSHPSASLELLRTIDAPIVIGTTGFTESQFVCIRDYSKRRAVLLAPNLSPGMGLMRKWLEHIPPWVKSTYDIVLHEEHHRDKKDAPSGTAKELLNLMIQRGFKDIAMHSVRAGGILGVHSFRFVSDTEELVISHQVFDRSVFARGCLQGVLSLVKKTPSLYTMEEIFDE